MACLFLYVGGVFKDTLGLSEFEVPNRGMIGE
jgi:hypothetical protein